MRVSQQLCYTLVHQYGRRCQMPVCKHKENVRKLIGSLNSRQTEAMGACRVVIRFLKRKLQEQDRRAALNMQLYDGAQEVSLRMSDTTQ